MPASGLTLAKNRNVCTGKVTDRPRVTVSVAITLDGYMDTTDRKAFQISSDQDLVEVHRLRAKSDAILVGAETIRTDDCRLTVRYGQNKSGRPMRVTLTRSGCINPDARFFAFDGARKLIFCPQTLESGLRDALPEQSAAVSYDGVSCPLSKIVETLRANGIQELLVEGGASIINQFLHNRLVDRLRIAIGPQIVGFAGKNRLFESPLFTAPSCRNYQTTAVEQFGSTVVNWYERKEAHGH